MSKFNDILDDFQEKAKTITDIEGWDALRVEFIGKKGIVSQQMANLKEATPEVKKELGQEINKLKSEINHELAVIRKNLDQEARAEKLKSTQVDVTMPADRGNLSRQNILLKTKRDIENIFLEMGYEVALGREVENDYYNFEALNLDENHPARDMQDTFYINPKELLRTHTSNIQSRVLEANKNREIKLICPGKVYRRDDDDATHSHQFIQIEGLVVVSNDSKYTANLKDLKLTLTIFVRKIFNDDRLSVRLRPSYFPFTEPSVEVDVTCSHCHGAGCSFCKQTGWIEILGAGIINPKVLEISGYDSNEFYGFAFGIGVERIALLKYNVEDIRNFYQNNNKFIEQF